MILCSVKKGKPDLRKKGSKLKLNLIKKIIEYFYNFIQCYKQQLLDNENPGVEEME